MLLSLIILAPSHAGSLQLFLQGEHEGDARRDVGVEAVAHQVGVDVAGANHVLRFAVDFVFGERVDGGRMCRSVGFDEEIIVSDVDSEFPKEKYIARLGSGNTVENARTDALGQIAGFFKSEVVACRMALPMRSMCRECVLSAVAKRWASRS